MPERCKTRLLCDDPVEDDYFGSHEGVATAMASLIREEQGGKSIALTGNWGAGKSSVVRMLKTELSRYEKETASLKFRTFVYDAWAHQGDPLRRSFLEALIRFTIRQDWCEEEKWKKKLGLSLNDRKTKTSPQPLGLPGRAYWWPLPFYSFRSGMCLCN